MDDASEMRIGEIVPEKLAYCVVPSDASGRH